MELFKRKNFYLFLITLLLAIAGVVIFYIATLPLAWLLGPITIITIYKCFRSQPLYWPVPLRNVGLVIIGIMLGSSFSPEIMSDLLIHSPAMLLSTLLMIGLTSLFAYFLSQKTEIDFLSSLLGSIPGGLSQILILSDGLANANQTVIIFMQITRVLFVIFLIPLLAFSLDQTDSSISVHPSIIEEIEEDATPGAEDDLTTATHDDIVADIFSGELWAVGEFVGYILGMVVFLWGAHRIRLPSPYLIGSIIGAIVLNVLGLAVSLSDPFFMFAQFALGAYISLQIQPRKLLHLKKMGLYLVVFNILLIAFGLVISLCLSMIYPISFQTAFLGTAPGGIAEMGVTAQAVQADLAIVTGYQLFRLFFILLLCVALTQWWKREAPTKQIDQTQKEFMD